MKSLEKTKSPEKTKSSAKGSTIFSVSLSVLRSESVLNAKCNLRFSCITQRELCVSRASSKAHLASPVPHAKCSLLLLQLTQSYFAYSSVHKLFASQASHAKFSLRLPRLTQSSVCVSVCSRKALFAFQPSHAKPSLRNRLLTHSKFAYQAQFYKNDLMMSLGTENRPPVLIDENEFTQWQDRFLNFIERQKNGNDMMIILSEGPFEKPKLASGLYKPTKEYSHDELSAYQADRDIKENLMLALPNSVYNRIDCFKTHPNLMWQQLEKIMLGSSVATQLRHTRRNQRSQGDDKETKSSKVYLLIKIRSKILFSQLQLFYFVVPAPTTIVHSRSFKRGVSSKAQADESTVRSSLFQSGPDLSKAAKTNQTERCREEFFF
ncbi:hypothetical protein L6452_22294 [Arctium lappa]|uniref:Uncharacterized protein n=1 Tax=Arctium lappa TaxID=4217 RepID=A0ACB9B3P5_ARCLA|nr:hypothetical protein L6452_22294 [Arctium lappa]